MISANTTTGLLLDGAGSDSNIVQGNYIGTDPAGTAAEPNGAGSSSTGARAGTWSAARRRGREPDLGELSGKRRAALRDTGTSGNLVEGNVLGLDATGTSGLLNGTGIVIAAGASGNTVGGATAGSGNTIMSSWDDGVALTGQETTGNAVTGNFIGGDSASFILGNRNGVAVRSGAHANTIGGTTPAAKNVIFRNRTDGVSIDGAGTTSSIVAGNDIGVNGNGVTVSGGARANTIGGTVAGARNLIWGSSFAGIALSGTGTKGNSVEGNFIGADTSGSTARATEPAWPSTTAHGNTIGGTTAGERNVISGNGQAGVVIPDSGTTGNVVGGRLRRHGLHRLGPPGQRFPWRGEVSSSASGTRSGGPPPASARNVISGNFPGRGVLRSGATGNLVGGQLHRRRRDGACRAAQPHRGQRRCRANNGHDRRDGSGRGNVISGSTDAGVSIDGGSGVVVAELIGTDASGTVPLGNVGDGVYVFGSSTTGVIGGTAGGAANTIAFNAAYGVELDASGGGPPGISIFANSIFSNYAAQISSPGPKPTIDSVITAGSTTTIRLGLAAIASTAYRIEVFTSPVCETSLQGEIEPGEGKTFLGAKSVATDASGNASLSISVATVAPGSIVTATATNLTGGQTSPFYTAPPHREVGYTRSG